MKIPSKNRSFLFLFIFIPTCLVSLAQSKPFIPLDFEYPEMLLSTPKTYVYRNTATGALRYKDLSIARKEGNIIVNWKEYDKFLSGDSCVEINDKCMEHFVTLYGETFKATVPEDSVYGDGSRFGEKVHTFYFDLDISISFFSSMRSRFFKDTSITWQGKTVPCLVIQSFYIQKLTNSLVPDKPQEVNGTIYFYFAKDIGLVRYQSEMGKENSIWQLIEIKDRSMLSDHSNG